VVRLVPSLILSVAEADQIAAILCPLISTLLKESA
jgi:acetylornithine aminotransferase